MNLKYRDELEWYYSDLNDSLCNIKGSLSMIVDTYKKISDDDKVKVCDNISNEVDKLYDKINQLYSEFYNQEEDK